MIKNKIIKTSSKSRSFFFILNSLYCKLNKKRTKNFSSKKYWDKRYALGGDSGDGSYGKLSVFKAKIINNFIAKHKIKTVIEFGCGDGNQLSLLKIPKYIGLDVSRKSIDLCTKRFKSDRNKSFSLYDPQIFTGEINEFKADLTLSLDVIYHLIEDYVFEKYMRDLFATSSKYVIIYASNTDKQEKFQAPHVFHRNFSSWIEANIPNWKLYKKIVNKYPEESFADFYIYKNNPDII